MTLSAGTDDYREELFCASEDGPYWVSVAALEGHARTGAEAISLVFDFVGPFEHEMTARRVTGRVVEVAGSLQFRKADHGTDLLDFWEITD